MSRFARKARRSHCTLEHTSAKPTRCRYAALLCCFRALFWIVANEADTTGFFACYRGWFRPLHRHSDETANDCYRSDSLFSLWSAFRKRPSPESAQVQRPSSASDHSWFVPNRKKVGLTPRRRLVDLLPARNLDEEPVKDHKVDRQKTPKYPIRQPHQSCADEGLSTITTDNNPMT